MDIRALRYFLAVAREENISKAAAVLHVTQPTLSRQIAQMEEELGSQMFVRGRHLTLTDAGILLRRRAEEIVELMDKMEGEFETSEDLGGIISIGSGVLKSSRLLSDVMLGFREKYPKVQYELYFNTSEYIKEQLDKGLLDFGLLMEPVDLGKYDYLRVHEKERWGLFMKRTHPLAEKEGIDKEDLKGALLVTPSRLSVQREITSWLGEDIQGLNILASCNILTNAVTLLNRGDVCFLTIEGAFGSQQNEEMIFRPLLPEMATSSVLVWKKFQPFAGTAGRFLEYFKKELT